MTTTDQPRWLRFSGLVFSFNFVAFSFVMFSCWFPTGFSATFSTVAFLSALPLFFSQVSRASISSFERVGLALFGWLFLSIFWSQAAVLKSLGYLFEYRVYFMVPVFSLALLVSPNTQKWSVYAAVLGALIALVTSYGLGLGWWTIEGAHLSLSNRIYHGFIMSVLLLGALLVARHASGGLSLAAIVVAALTVYNVINIETGRTGYLLVISVSLTVILLSFRRLHAAFVLLLVGVCVVVAYLTLDQFSARIDETLTNLQLMLLNADYHSSVGYRLEFYRVALEIFADNSVFGVGIGDVVPELSRWYNNGDLRVPTDNIHSEVLTMLVAGGVPALCLFLMFVGSIGFTGLQARKEKKFTGEMSISLASIFFVASLFNSFLKDYGEKHAAMIILSLIAAKLLQRHPI